MLVRSRAPWAHLWIPRRVLERSWVSVELQAPALCPRRVATATCTHVSSYATLVCAFFVLELETNFLSISPKDELVSVLLVQVFETRTTSFRLALAAISSGSSTFPEAFSARSFTVDASFVGFARERFDVCGLTVGESCRGSFGG